MTMHGSNEEIVVDSWRTTGGDRVEVYRGAIDCRNPGCDLAHYGGDYHWRVRAGNGEIVGQGEGHPRKADAVKAAGRHHPPLGQENVGRSKLSWQLDPERHRFSPVVEGSRMCIMCGLPDERHPNKRPG